MARLVRSPRFKRDLVDVLAYTRTRWGTEQARTYQHIVRDALALISRDPERGVSREDLRPGIRALHIRQVGRPARHIVFYRVQSSDEVDILRLLHDAMDFARHFGEVG
jgi:toxin ParE1/3/4